jgi:hypothetical protein
MYVPRENLRDEQPLQQSRVSRVNVVTDKSNSSGLDRENIDFSQISTYCARSAE